MIVREMDLPAERPRVVTFAVPIDDHQHLAVLAEFGWLLASTGHRVLVVAGAPMASRLQEALQWFPRIAPRTDVSRVLRSLTTELVGSPVRAGTLERFALPGQSAALDVFTWHETQAHETQAHETAALRQGLTAQGATAVRTGLRTWPYDVLLVARPMSAARRTAAHSDLVVLCLSATDPGARAAAAGMKDIRAADPNCELVGLVPYSVFEDRGRVDRHLRRFWQDGKPATTHAPERWHGLVELPCPRPPDAPASLTTLLVDPADDQGVARTVAGFERLAELVFGRHVPLRPELAVQLRGRYRRRIGGVADQRDQVLVAFASPDQGWAEWVVAELSHAGVQASFLPRRGETVPELTAGNTLALLGPPDRYPEQVQRILARVVDEPGGPDTPEILYVRMPAPGPADEPALGDLAHDHPRMHLVDLSKLVSPRDRIWSIGPGNVPLYEAEASARLRAPLLLPARKPREGQLAGQDSPTRATTFRDAWRPRFPLADRPRTATNVVAPNRLFVGRELEIEALRAALHTGDRVTVTGPAGAGKSEIVWEYINRFSHDYDVTWWIPAHDRAAVGASFRELLLSLGEPVVHHPADPVPVSPASPTLSRIAARAAEAPDHHPARWLLVYDDADDLAQLDGKLLPAGTCHVVITTRAEAGPGALAVSWLSEEDSAQLVTHRMPFCPKQTAAMLSRALGNSPLALRLAESVISHRLPSVRASGLRGADLARQAVDGYLRDLPGAGTPVERALAVTLAELTRSGPIERFAVRLATMAAFLSPQGVDLRLVRSTAMLDQLTAIAATDSGDDGDLLVRDALRIDEVLRVGDLFGLFRVDWKRTASLRLHRTAAAALRAMSDPARLAAVHAATLTVLSRYAPNDAEVEDRKYDEEQRELHRHLVASGAMEATDPQIRRWVVKQLRYAMLYSGDPDTRATALVAAERLRRQWADGSGDSPELLPRLDQACALLYQTDRRPQRALEAQQSAISGLRDVVGNDHVRTFHASDLEAWYLRTLGRFRAAIGPASAAYEGLHQRLGADHPLALRAASNYANALFLSGEFRRAASLEKDTLNRWQAQVGRGHEATWLCAAALGRYLQHLGDHEAAIELLERAREAAAIRHRGARVAAILRDLAAIDRIRGEYDLARKRDQDALEQRRGEADPTESPWEHFSCQLALAHDEYLLGRPARAVEVADQSRAEYDELAPWHPCGHLYRLNLGVFQHAAGLRAEAARSVRLAFDGLRDGLGIHHPWSLAAAVDLRALAISTNMETPDAIDLATVGSDCRQQLGEYHPFTRKALHNDRTIERGVDSGGDHILQWIIVDLP